MRTQTQSKPERGKIYPTHGGNKLYFPSEKELAEEDLSRYSVTSKQKESMFWFYCKKEYEWLSEISVQREGFFIDKEGFIDLGRGGFGISVDALSGNVKERTLARRIYHTIKQAEAKEAARVI